MKNLHIPYIVELITFISSGGLFTATAVMNQYVYQVISEMHNYTANNSIDYCASNQSSAEDDVVAAEAARWQMYINLSSGIPAMFSSVMLTSWSDKVGRKIALAISLCGYVISSVLQVIVIIFSWPLYMLIISNFFNGAFGGSCAFLNIGMAFLSDVTTREQRTTRFTILECSMGLGGGLISFACGFWITADGFIPSSIAAVGCNILSLCLVIFMPGKVGLKHHSVNCENSSDESFLGENVTNSYESLENDVMDADCSKNNMKINVTRMEMIRLIYTSERSICHLCDEGYYMKQESPCPHGGGLRKGRVWRIWFYLISFSIFLYPIFGGIVFETIYFISYPICFSQTYIGIRALLTYGWAMTMAPLAVLFFKKVLQWTNRSIIIQSIIVMIGIDLLTAFATKSYMVFIASTLYVFIQANSPIIRCQISALASMSEQGAALSLLFGVENFTLMFGKISYLLIYQATLPIFNGFVWCYSAVLLLIPLVLMIIVWIADKKKLDRKVEVDNERTPLLKS